MNGINPEFWISDASITRRLTSTISATISANFVEEILVGHLASCSL